MFENISHYRKVLASQSPRRQQLLAGLGLSFDVIPTDADESYPEDMIHLEIAEYVSRNKAKAYFEGHAGDNDLVIAADTLVFIKGRVLSKPEDEKDAFRMLSLLSGATHEVITGVTIATKQRMESFYDLSKVHFAKLNEEEIHHYINNYKPFDKAGAYGIQEWIGYIGIDNIEGSYFNVMGLPTRKVYDYLTRF